MVKAKLVKQSLSPFSSPSPHKDTDWPRLSSASQWSVTWLCSLFWGNWAQSGDGTRGCPRCPGRGDKPCHTSTCSSAFRGGEGAPGRQLPWVFGLAVICSSLAVRSCFPCLCRELVLFPGGWTRARGSQQRGARTFTKGASEELAGLWWPLCWVCFDGRLWRERLLRGVWGVEKRKNGGGLGLSAAGCCVGILWSMWKLEYMQQSCSECTVMWSFSVEVFTQWLVHYISKSNLLKRQCLTCNYILIGLIEILPWIQLLPWQGELS